MWLWLKKLEKQNRSQNRTMTFVILGMLIVVVCACEVASGFICTLNNNMTQSVGANISITHFIYRQTPLEVEAPNINLLKSVEIPLSTGPTWLVMLYMDADEEILKKDIYTELKKLMGSAQLTRYI
jgi:hypothetical protein